MLVTNKNFTFGRPKPKPIEKSKIAKSTDNTKVYVEDHFSIEDLDYIQNKESDHNDLGHGGRYIAPKFYD